MNIDICGGDLRKKDKTPIRNVIGKQIKRIFQRFSEDEEFRQNLDSFIVKLSTRLGKIETIDFIKNRIEAISYLDRIKYGENPKNYIDYVFGKLTEAFNNNKERIKKNYLFT